MSKTERIKLLQGMHSRTRRATASKEAAIQYLIELGALTKKGNYKRHLRPKCTKNEAA